MCFRAKGNICNASWQEMISALSIFFFFLIQCVLLTTCHKVLGYTCLSHQACILASFLAVSSVRRTSWVQLFFLPCCVEDACCNSHLQIIISCMCTQWETNFCDSSWIDSCPRMPVFAQAGKSKVAQFKSVRIYFWFIVVWFTFFNSTVWGGCIALSTSVTFGVDRDRQK